MNISNIKTDFAVYHAVKDVEADIKGRNIAALGTGLATLLALLLPILQPLGAAHGLTIDDATMGYVRNLLLGVAGLCLAPHLKSGPPTVAVVAGNGAPGGSPASGQGPLDPPVGGQAANSPAPVAVRDRPATSDPTEGVVLGG